MLHGGALHEGHRDMRNCVAGVSRKNQYELDSDRAAAVVAAVISAQHLEASTGYVNTVLEYAQGRGKHELVNLRRVC